MLYMVEMTLAEELTDDDWTRWQADMKPTSLFVTVPGISTAQRFKGVNIRLSYCGIYSIASADVMSGEAYRGIGGGRFNTDRWNPYITLWERNLFDGLAAVPDVDDSQVVLIADHATPENPIWDFEHSVLTAVGLDRTTPFRSLAILDRSAAEKQFPSGFGTTRVYEPGTPPVRSTVE